MNKALDVSNLKLPVPVHVYNDAGIIGVANL